MIDLMKRKHLLSCAATSALLVAVGADAAHAQSGPGATPGGPEADASPAIEEIIVTARKREENLQNTPIAITAVSAAQLEAKGAVDLTAMQNIAPNLTLKTGGGTSGATFTPVINIRGIGQGDFTINTDPGVGVYIDGVYLGRSLGSVLDLADVERVEVLRGPQGTLFGRNTIGGAISMVSKAPDPSALSGTISLAGGSREFAQVRASVNLPISDNLAIRVAAMARHRDGYVDALEYNDFRLGGEKLWGVRAALRYEPTSNLTIDLAFDHTERRDPPSAAVALQLGDVSVAQTGPTGTLATAFNRGNVPASVARPPFISVDAPRCATDAAFRNSSRTCYGNAWLEGNRGNHSVWTDRAGNKITPSNDLNVTGYMGTLALDTGIGTFKSITAYREFDSTFYGDLDFTPYPIFGNNNAPFNQQQFSQELQLVGSAFDGRIDYVLGGYYFEESGDQAVDLFAPGNIPAAQAPALAPFLPYFQTTTRTIDNSSKAGYAQLTFAITDALKLTGGIRYTDEKKDYVVTQSRSVGAVQSAAGVQSTKLWTPMVNLAWQATENILLYGTYSEGYRAGGFAARFSGGLISPLPSYDPEFVISYEAGLKTQLFDRRLTFNLAAFRIDYSDIQVTATTQGLAGFVLNLADARFTGFEAEARAVIGGGFTLTASAGYTDKKLTFVNPGTVSSEGTNAVVPITTDSILPGPAWQLNGSIQHRAQLGNGGRLDSSFDIHYESSESNSVANYPIIVQEGYAEAEARIAYTFPGNRYTFAVGARNLFDATYYTTKTLSSSSGSVYGTLARPREIYAQLSARF
ncbi:TonB-dependent receptor [Sphingomonas sp.]|uniref:TonB-dependent receptor n=1 Tax=Sphingomonas sp. TaxID=28214 RepID=UPI001820DC43|nr:TonB-dependent receptor [Sphingomonas sp.]MBA4761826.1 TonB-dependent receptor [Sphingomonas sp.]